MSITSDRVEINAKLRTMGLQTFKNNKEYQTHLETKLNASTSTIEKASDDFKQDVDKQFKLYKDIQHDIKSLRATTRNYMAFQNAKDKSLWSAESVKRMEKNIAEKDYVISQKLQLLSGDITKFDYNVNLKQATNIKDSMGYAVLTAEKMKKTSTFEKMIESETQSGLFGIVPTLSTKNFKNAYLDLFVNKFVKIEYEDGTQKEVQIYQILNTTDTKRIWKAIDYVRQYVVSDLKNSDKYLDESVNRVVNNMNNSAFNDILIPGIKIV